MKAFATNPGDHSVGIQSHTVIIDFGNIDPIPPGEERAWARTQLAEAIASIMGDAYEVLFEDECPDCGKVGCMGNCIVPAVV